LAGNIRAYIEKICLNSGVSDIPDFLKNVMESNTNIMGPYSKLSKILFDNKAIKNCNSKMKY